MGTTLTGKRVQNTYDSLLKIGDNDNLTGTAKRIGDGLGNDSPIFLSTTKIGIGVTPTYEFQTNSHAKIGGNLIVGGNLTVNGTTTIIDSTVIAIGDNMMEMAKDNVSNTMDIGWYGTINESGEKYVGVFYDASSGVTTPEFHIGLGTVEPSSTASWTTKGKLVIGALDATTGVFSGQVTIPATPSASTDAASKGYVDSSISSGSVEVAKRIEITVKNISGGSLSKGTIVHASPSVSPPSGNVVEVIAADYDDATKMPGIGVLNETIANEAEGAAVMIGAVSGINTSSFSAGDELYVGNNGVFTNTKPTANNELIQKIAIVLKVHASNGSIKVFGAGRANDVPNQISRNVNFTDNSKLTFGDSTTPDFQIYHDGNNSYINEDGTGVLAIQSNGTEVQINKGTTEYMARFITDGAVNLYYDNSKKFETTSGGILVTGDINLTGTAIYKNSGDLEIKAQTIRIKGVTTNENLAGFTENGSVELYYDNSKKFETTSGGISVTGLGQFSNKILVADGSVSAPSYSFTSDTDTGFYIDGASIKLAIGGSNKVTFAGTQTTIEEKLYVNDFISADDKVIIEGENAYLQIQDVSQETYTSLYSLDAESVLSYTHGAFSLRTGFFDGTVVFSVDSSRNVTFNNNVLPDVDSANDLGSTSLRWANVWADNINGGTPVNGGGTPNDVVMWSDGDTLTDAPIAISGNNATFAGNVELASGTTLFGMDTIRLVNGSNARNLSCNGAGNLLISNAANNASIFHLQDSALTLGSSIGTGTLALYAGAATFAGSVSANKRILVTTDGTYAYGINVSSSDQSHSRIRITNTGSGGETYSIMVGTHGVSNAGFAIRNETDSTTPLQFDTNDNATFAGDVSININTKIGEISGYNGVTLNGTLDINNYNFLSRSSDKHLFINRSSSADIFFRENNSDQVVIKSGGNVGIGTTSPSHKLHVNGVITANDSIQVQNDDSGFICRNSAGTVIGTIGAESSSTPNVGRFTVRNNGNIKIDFNSNGNSYFVSGNVGIGTTSPSEKLTLQLDTQNQAFSGKNGTDYLWFLRNEAGAGARQSGRFQLMDTDVTTVNIESASNRNTYFNAGNVGIGTDSPSAILHTDSASTGEVVGLALSNSNTSFSANESVSIKFGVGSSTALAHGKILVANTDNGFGSNGYMAFHTRGSDSIAERMRIDSSGNVIIGNTSVDNPNSLSKVLEIENGGSVGVILNDSRDTPIGLENRGAVFHLTHNTNSRLVVNGASGNVGIGTTSPAQPLSVHGNFLVRTTNADGNKNRMQCIVGGSSDAANLYLYYGNSGDGTLSVRINAQGDSYFNGGNVGIGTTSPAAKLDVQGTDALFITRTSSGLATYIENDGGYPFMAMYQIGGGAKVLINTNGNSYFNGGSLGIGTSLPSKKLHIYNTASADVALLESTQVFSTLAFKSSTNSSTVTVGIDGAGNAAFENKLSSGNMRFVTNGSERMRLTSDGDILLGGITSVGNTHASFDSASNDRMIFNIGSSTTSSVDIINFRNPNGIVGGINTDGFTTSFSSSSDYRLKENVVKLTNALDKVSELKPSRFNFINEQKTVNGFLAHEVENIVPEAISGTKDQVDDQGNPIYQRIDQSKLVPLLVGAIQELKEEIEILRSQINS